ncbi:MAG: HAD family hydrolase [Kiritimatiellae bacterium]|nr:HAD family hydrolase [Kiritimatiellia bacterium]
MSSIVPFPNRIQALVFDYGNTVVPFGAREIARCDAALAAALGERYGPPDVNRLTAIRNEDRMAPYRGDPPEYRENNLPRITARAVRMLYGKEPSPDDLQRLILSRFQAFVDAVSAPEPVPPLLERLAARYRLALCSNYPDGSAIRASLKRTGLDRFFDPVIVSADYGFVKPHPALFRELLRALGLAAENVAFIGDNWLADVQGARCAGLWSVWCRQWEAPESMPRSADDLAPHAEIRHLTELEAMITPRDPDGDSAPSTPRAPRGTV